MLSGFLMYNYTVKNNKKNELMSKVNLVKLNLIKMVLEAKGFKKTWLVGKLLKVV